MIWWRCSIKICAYTQTHTKLHNIFANAHTPVLNIEQMRKKWRKSSIPIKSVTSFFFVLFCYVWFVLFFSFFLLLRCCLFPNGKIDCKKYKVFKFHSNRTRYFMWMCACARAMFFIKSNDFLFLNKFIPLAFDFVDYLVGK